MSQFSSFFLSLFVCLFIFPHLVRLCCKTQGFVVTWQPNLLVIKCVIEKPSVKMPPIRFGCKAEALLRCVCWVQSRMSLDWKNEMVKIQSSIDWTMFCITAAPPPLTFSSIMFVLPHYEPLILFLSFFLSPSLKLSPSLLVSLSLSLLLSPPLSQSLPRSCLSSIISCASRAALSSFACSTSDRMHTSAT